MRGTFQTISILDIFSLQQKLVGLFDHWFILEQYNFPGTLSSWLWWEQPCQHSRTGLVAMAVHHAALIRASLQSDINLILLWQVFWIFNSRFIVGHVFFALWITKVENAWLQRQKERLELTSSESGKRWRIKKAFELLVFICFEAWRHLCLWDILIFLWESPLLKICLLWFGFSFFC